MKVKVPTGEIIEVEVPVIVTPKVTPIVVEVGTPITENDVKKRIDLPEGWEIVEVGKIPTTETPGAKPVVKVKVKLPSGEIVEVDVPVIVTPKVTPTPRPEKPSTTEVTVNPATAKTSDSTEVKESKDDSKVLPNTGTKANASLLGLGILGALSGFGLLGRKKKED